MATEVVCKVVPGGLRVVNAAEATKLEHMIGKEVSARIYIPRNLKFHRKFFAMLKTALEMVDVEMNDEQWRAWVTAGAGYCDYQKHGEKIVAVPKSISFASMEEAEFQRLYNDCLTFICANYIHGETPESFDALLQFM